MDHPMVSRGIVIDDATGFTECLAADTALIEVVFPCRCPYKLATVLGQLFLEAL